MRTRYIAGLAGLLFSLAPIAAPAAEPPMTTPDWQAIITAQIDSLRQGDAAAALQLSTRAFQLSYRNAPQMFIDAIVSAGYAPILKSRSHGFGEFVQVRPHTAAQLVRVVGSDGLVYDVVYDLVEEADGWRVKNVVLMDQNGVLV